MDFLKSQFERIQQQVAALTPSQKMLTGTLVTIMVMTLVWWGRYAGTAEMEPVLDQAMSADEMGRIEATLSSKGIDYKTSNDRILVPTERKIEALSVLGFNGALPKDTANGFDEIIKQLSPWDGAGRQNAMFNHGKELTLSRIVSNFPDVESAVVVIDPRTERHIGNDIESTATAMVRMKSGTHAGKQLVKAAASVIAGAQSGLAMKNIRVVVDGVAQRVADTNPEAGVDPDSLLEIRENAEQMFARKVMDHLADIPGVLVSVTVTVNNQAVSQDKTSVDEKKSLHVEAETDTQTHEQVTPGAPGAAEAGAAPNTGIALTPNPTATGESTSNESQDHTKFTNVPAITREHIDTAAGMTTPVAASVRIPHSHFVLVAKNLGDGKDPDAQTIKQTIEDERVKTAKAVANTLGLANVSDVSVEVYADAMPLADAAPQVSAASTMTLALGGHFKEIALGALALLSLFMVSTMVKKATPAMPAPALAAPATPRNILNAGDVVAGEAAEGSTLLNGVEMDEESVRNQQMMEQVATLVDENPDTAASLVKRWMNQG